MADTITVGTNVIQIVPNAAGISTFNAATYFSNGIRCIGISFIGSNAADVFKVRDGSATANFLVPKLSGIQDNIGFDPPIDCTPYILSTDQTLTIPANCIMSIYYV